MSLKNKNKNIESDKRTDDLLERINYFLKNKSNFLLIISLLIYLLFSILLFNKLISLGGDDSAYIQRSFHFIKNFTFPSYQGPLYPLILSPFILIFGVNIIVLKFLSLVFLLLFIYIFYLSFNNRIPSFLLISSILFFSMNASLLYFSSQTYNEAFFIFLQILFFFYFFKKFINVNDPKEKLKDNLKDYLFLSVFLLSLGLTRSIAYSSLFGVIGFFILYGRWISATKVVFSFGICYSFYTLIKKIIWSSSGADFSSQGRGLLYKNYYNHAEGKEDLAGFIHRLIDNSNLYLSKHFAVFASIRDQVVGMQIKSTITILIYILFIIALIFLYKKNKFLFFTGIYTSIYCVSTFLVLQKNWDQARLIIPVAPLIFLILISGIYYLLKLEKIKNFQFLLPLIILLLLFSSFKNIAKKAEERNNLEGPWYDLTPDWINYIKCSQWAAKNLPKDALVASRKPSISFIYSKGKEFYGIYRFTTLNTSDIFNGLEDSMYVVSPFNSIFNNNVAAPIQAHMRSNLSFILNNNGNLVGVFKTGKKSNPTILNILQQQNVSFTTSPKQYFAEQSIDATKTYTVSPDSLLNVFQKGNVDYVIMANLRAVPHMKTERTVNTIQRNLVFIEQKYPGIFEKVVQIGENNDEPASVYRIRYEKYGLKK